MTNKNKTIKKITMVYRLAFLLFLTACASDYPSPYAPDYKPTSATGTQGVWAPPLVRTTVTDTSFTGYYASLRPFAADKKPIYQRPTGLLDLQGVAARDAELSRQRDSQKQNFITANENKRLTDKEAALLAEREAIKKRQY
jgi:hypothetical protein